MCDYSNKDNFLKVRCQTINTQTNAILSIGLIRRPTNIYVVIHAQNMFLASLVLGMVTAILPWWDVFCLISLLHLTPPCHPSLFLEPPAQRT